MAIRKGRPVVLAAHSSLVSPIFLACSPSAERGREVGGSPHSSFSSPLSVLHFPAPSFFPSFFARVSDGSSGNPSCHAVSHKQIKEATRPDDERRKRRRKKGL